MYDQHGKLIIIHEYQSQDLQPFLNPICKQTYNALPKIYGKNRKKKYNTHPNDVSLSLQRHKLARDCCSRHLEDNHRAVTDVKQLRKQKIDDLLIPPQYKSSTRGKYQNLHNSLEQMSSRKPALKAKKKVLLPNLKDFYFQELTEQQSAHKIYHPTDDSPSDSKLINLTAAKNSVIHDIRKNIKTDYSSSSEYVQTQEQDLQGTNRKKLKTHIKSLTEHGLDNKKYYQHLQNQQESKDNPRYKVADIRSSTNSQAFSISSSAIQKGSKLSTVFHKYKRKMTSKNEDQRPERKRSRVYSVLSNGLFKIPEEQEFQDYLVNYQPMDDKFDLKTLVKQPDFHIIPADGKVYFGQITNKQKNGQGITVSQKQIFQGKYNMNMKTEGCQKNRDGVYTGEFMNGKRHGQGKFAWYNGEVFQGQWREGKKNGFGIWKSPKGDSYEGEWKDNRQTGSGIYIHYGGSKYKGEFKDFLKHGKGREEFPNGDRYDGQYLQGKPHGRGKYAWANGDTYQGRFQQGSRSGFGVLIRKSGEIYEGQFKNDLKHGLGKQRFRSGEQFEGEFKNGERFCGKLKTKAGALINITQ